MDWIFPTIEFSLILLAALWVWSRYAPAAFLRWLGRLVLVLAVWNYLASSPLIAHSLLHELEQQYTRPSLDDIPRDSLIIVLSSGWTHISTEGQEVRLDDTGWERLAAAMQIYKIKGGRLLFVGQPEFGNSQSVAKEMARYAIIFGASENDILVEESSTNTYENIMNSTATIRQLARPTVLVTSAWHMPRAMGVAQHLGLKIQAYPCCGVATARRHLSQLIPSQGAIGYMSIAVHEYTGIFIYRLKGWM